LTEENPLRIQLERIAMEENAEKRYMTPDEVAAYIGVSKVTIYRMVRNRIIPFIPIMTGHDKRFDRKAIDDWMARRMIKARVAV